VPLHDAKGDDVNMRVLFTFSLTLAICLAGGCSQKRHLDAHNRGVEQLAGGDIDAASASFRDALARASRNPDSVCGLALALAQSGKPAEAIELLSDFLRRVPEATAPTELLAHLHIEQGNLDEARNLIERVAAPSPRLLTQLARVHVGSGDPELAAERLAEALQMEPAYAPALYNLAVLKRAEPDTVEEAETLFLKFRDAAPENFRAGATIEEFLSGMLPEPGDRTQGAPLPDTQREAAYHALLDQAKAAVSTDNLDAADLILRQAIANYPDRPDALWLRASLFYRAQNMPDEAARMFARFKHLFPQDPRCTQIPKGLNLPTLMPTAATAEEFLKEGLRYYQQGNHPAAIAAYKNALQLSPDFATAHYNLGLAYKGAKQFAEAAAAFRSATKADTNKIKAWYMLGVTEMERGRVDLALDALNTLLRDHPDYARAHYLLGILYDREQHPVAARNHFQTFLEMESKGPAANYARQWLNTHKEAE
jgi:tetratricopeptide (TPR) repeat protein